MWIAIALLGVSAFMATIVQWFTAIGCKGDVEKAAPEYASKLYSSVLFREPVPPNVVAAVSLMRQVSAAWLILCAAFALMLAAMMVQR